MSYVVLFVRGKERSDNGTREVLENFRRCKINHRIVDLTEKVDLYGHKVTLEGAFAMDFSKNGRIKIPITPLATADGKLFNGSEEIIKNLGYLSEKYPSF